MNSSNKWWIDPRDGATALAKLWSEAYVQRRSQEFVVLHGTFLLIQSEQQPVLLTFIVNPMWPRTRNHERERNLSQVHRTLCVDRFGLRQQQLRTRRRPAVAAQFCLYGSHKDGAGAARGAKARVGACRPGEEVGHSRCDHLPGGWKEVQVAEAPPADDLRYDA